MKYHLNVGLTIGLILFVTSVFADVIISGGSGRGLRWPEQRIQFSNVTSLGKYVLHLQFKDFTNTIRKDIIIRKDTTYFMPEHGGAPSPRLRFFALLNKKSTDTIEINETDIDYNFIPIKNNKLQFSRKPQKGSLSTIGNINNTDNEVNDMGRFALSGMDKLLVTLSLSAFAGLFIVFIFYKKKGVLSGNRIPSV